MFVSASPRAEADGKPSRKLAVAFAFFCALNTRVP